MQLYLVLALIFALAIAIFAVQNTAAVTVAFLFWNFKTSLVIVILGSTILGALIVFAVGGFKSWNTRKKIKSLTDENQKLKKDLEYYEPSEEKVEE